MNASPRSPGSPLPPGGARRIAAACLRFDQAWKTAPQRPRLEDFLLPGPAPDERRELFRALLEVELDYRCAAGEVPALADYLPRFPDLADLARAVFDARGTIPPERPPDHLGRYRITGELGRGAFGVVYKGRDDDLGRDVAVKVPRPDLVARLGGIDSYLREARVVAGLAHPHIVAVHDLGHTPDGFCYVVYAFIPGSDLNRRLGQGPRFGCRDAALLVADMTDALHHAHQRRVFHRDVKPANILLDPAGKPYLTDFGLALRDQEHGLGATLAGTPAYMSPEQARGESHRVDGRSDLFSLGAVFYELLTGQRPFHGSRAEVLERIANGDPQPPRQLDPAIPAELQRIALKALARLLRDRYSTAADLASDLRAWLAAPSAAPGAGVADPPGATCAPGSPGSDPLPVCVVPRGLRSFDARDADFFLDLLPGVRERDGTPSALQFWKARLEAVEADSTFPVGLLYGPSGCGKSSLVKAGLVPRLARHVVAVYLEATAEDTEARLLAALRKSCPGLPADRDLAETLTSLRNGVDRSPGQKVVLILDQFEQWLHARRPEDCSELARALRQCDGGRVQVLLLLRDDFYMAAARFMQSVEVPLQEGHNQAAVDLFAPRHARKVLAAFGRAYGALPADGSLSQAQASFLDSAVAGLAEDGLVMCVRLALFAEMVKARAWEPPTLQALGGVGGVGLAFLEETFTARTAPPAHRLHQDAARAVLKALLPEPGASLKGHKRSQAELLSASGYGLRPGGFATLLGILDRELRLITPTEPEEAEHPERSYQLTHDYLVPAIREWLTRKQKETRRGRAELRLAERAALWEARPETRHLPSWWEWLSITVFTPRRDWTQPQRRMMNKAGQRGVVLVTLLPLAALAGWGVSVHVANQNKADRAAALVRGLLEVPTDQVPARIAEIQAYRPWADPLLRQGYAAAGADSHEKLHAALALRPLDEERAAYLYRRLLDAEPAAWAVICQALVDHQEALRDRLWAVVERPDRGRGETQRLRAAAALALYDPESPNWDNAAAALAEDLVTVPAAHRGAWRAALHPVRHRLLPPLWVFIRDDSHPDMERLLATDLLLEYAADRPDVLCNLLLDAQEKQFALLFPRVLLQAERAVPLLRETVQTPLETKETEEEKEALARRQAKAAVALVRLGEGDHAWPLLRQRPDPRARSHLIHAFAPLGTERSLLIRHLRDEKAVSIRCALLLALGEFSPNWGAGGPGELYELVNRLYDEPDAGLHGAAEWVLRDWGTRIATDWWTGIEQLEHIGREVARREGRGESYWYVNRQGQSMVVVPEPGTFRMGSPSTEAGRDKSLTGGELLHDKQIGRSFAIAAHEVTVDQFRKFRPGHEVQSTSSGDCPVTRVTWYDAAAYCNWLSDREGLQKCYREPVGEGMTPYPDYLKRTGYRLPTEAEWEYACRAGSCTSRYYGEGTDLLGRYAHCQRALRPIRALLPTIQAVGRLKPNDFGLFDMLGNAQEWCQDQYRPYQPGPGNRSVRGEDVGDREPVPVDLSRRATWRRRSFRLRRLACPDR